MAPFSIVDVFDEVDDKLYAFEQLYSEILNEHAPLKQTVVRGNQVPYMTEKWRKAIRHRNKLWRLFMRDRTDVNYNQYKIQRNICTSLRRKAIKDHFVKKSSEPENPREFWNAYRPFLHGKTKQANDIIIKENNVIINDKKEIAELFNAHFIQIADSVPLIKETDYGQFFENHPSIRAIHEKNRAANAPLCFNFEHINQAQVERSLLDVNVHKSCGHDMLPPRLVKESATVIAEPITNILNTSIDQGCYPSAWKMGQVTPLFKKNDEFNKANYRPVTVLPVLNNIYERTLATQLGEFYSAILSDFISSYRKFYSCETALLRLTEDWRRMRDRGELVAVVSMDLSKAFDVIQHDLLIAKLKAYGIGEGSCALLKDYLSGRQQRVKIGDTFSNWADTRRGVPQGSVFRPIFFNIFINDLFCHIKYAKLNAYADDHQIYSSNLDPHALEDCICQEVNVANQWYKNNGMIVNETKHQALILGKTDYNFCFPVNSSIDILEMTIDNKLSFDNHISVICKKINNQFNVMLRFRKLIDKETLLKLYKAFILPHFYYCSSVWHFYGARNTKKLDNLNKRILRLILRDYSSPYDILLGKVNLKSLFIRRLQNLMITLYKSLFFANYPAYLKDMFTERSSSYNLHGNHILALSNPKTTTYGLHSFSYVASKIWNSLPDTYKTLNFLHSSGRSSNMKPFHNKSSPTPLCMHDSVFSLEIIMVMWYSIFYCILFYFFSFSPFYNLFSRRN